MGSAKKNGWPLDRAPRLDTLSAVAGFAVLRSGRRRPVYFELGVQAGRGLMELFEITLTCPGCGTECRGMVPGTFDAGHMRCGRCGKSVCRIAALKGFVYILSNPRMPGLFKVGCSTRPVEERVAELNSATGVPAPFVVEAYFASSAPDEHEREAHRRLAARRLEGREFFEAELAQIVRTVEDIVGTHAAYLRQPHPASDQKPVLPIFEAGSRWSCGLCKHQWALAQPSTVEKCPLCSATSVVRLSGSAMLGDSRGDGSGERRSIHS